MDERCLQAFEQWAGQLTWGYDGDGYPIGLPLERRETAYRHPDTQLAWAAFQAAWYHPRKDLSFLQSDGSSGA
ncbi:hypothetical protein KSF73_12475 [Burkholderiaceae bacterium DAT-1]|nr:hypothetical protein [Burkholderiaceae bacterium DAT-1]